MLKNLRILFVLFVSLLVLSSITLATDINMNLTSEDSSISSNLNEIVDNYEEENVIDDITDDTTATEFDSALISSNSATETNELSLTDILNIILIAVGIVLILLGIAILIRARS